MARKKKINTKVSVRQATPEELSQASKEIKKIHKTQTIGHSPQMLKQFAKDTGMSKQYVNLLERRSVKHQQAHLHRCVVCQMPIDENNHSGRCPRHQSENLGNVTEAEMQVLSILSQINPAYAERFNQTREGRPSDPNHWKYPGKRVREED